VVAAQRSYAYFCVEVALRPAIVNLAELSQQKCITRISCGVRRSFGRAVQEDPGLARMKQCSKCLILAKALHNYIPLAAQATALSMK
jgi:hypothetical protein